MRNVTDTTATGLAPSTSCSVVVFGDKPRSGIWRVWLLLILPPVLLMALSFGYAVFVVTLARGDRSVIGPAMGPALPYIVLVNHSLLFALMLWFMKLDGTSMRQVGWPLPWRLSASLAREVLVGLVAGVVLYVVHQYVSGPLVAWMAADAPTLRMASNSAPLGSNLALALGSGIVLGGFVEEQLYRGYVLVRLTERRSLPMAMVPMLVFFGLLHFGLGWTGMLVATMTGFTLTLLFIWRRSLVSVVIAHALINTLVLTL